MSCISPSFTMFPPAVFASLIFFYLLFSTFYIFLTLYRYLCLFLMLCVYPWQCFPAAMVSSPIFVSFCSLSSIISTPYYFPLLRVLYIFPSQCFLHPLFPSIFVSLSFYSLPSIFSEHFITIYFPFVFLRISPPQCFLLTVLFFLFPLPSILYLFPSLGSIVPLHNVPSLHCSLLFKSCTFLSIFSSSYILNTLSLFFFFSSLRQALYFPFTLFPPTALLPSLIFFYLLFSVFHIFLTLNHKFFFPSTGSIIPLHLPLCSFPPPVFLLLSFLNTF